MQFYTKHIWNFAMSGFTKERGERLKSNFLKMSSEEEKLNGSEMFNKRCRLLCKNASNTVSKTPLSRLFLFYRFPRFRRLLSWKRSGLFVQQRKNKETPFQRIPYDEIIVRCQRLQREPKDIFRCSCQRLPFQAMKTNMLALALRWYLAV